MSEFFSVTEKNSDIRSKNSDIRSKNTTHKAHTTLNFTENIGEKVGHIGGKVGHIGGKVGHIGEKDGTTTSGPEGTFLIGTRNILGRIPNVVSSVTTYNISMDLMNWVDMS